MPLPRVCSFIAVFTVSISALALAQDDEPPPEDREWHTVAGARRGVSFFPLHRHPGVEYEVGDTLAFDRYHTAPVMDAWLRRWEERYPELVDVYEVGRSFEGRPILQATLTNEENGPATDKPAAYFEGGRHSGEITGSESVLWLIQHLLAGYGSDPEITALLDTKAIHLRPQNNPDGSTLYVHTAQANRSSVRPHDTDRDGLVDEDPPEDLDGDGVIYSIRRRPGPDEQEDADYVIDERDPTGRLMQRVLDGEGDWIVFSEGIDNDGDGRINEDGIGGLDLHRNYPENWRPEPGRDATGRGRTQRGAGAYPLSEPETRLTVIWLLEHPHVSVVNSMDTRVPMHLRPPSTSRSDERMYPEDLRYYEEFDRIGKEITGYPWAGDVYNTYMTRTAVDRVTGDPNLPSPLFGHGPDFGYFYYGSIWYGDELWNGGRMEDYNDDGEVDEVDALIWDDRENGSDGFREWEPFVHPEYGAVEIGGFHPKFFSQNPPAHELERWARNQALFNLEMATWLPQLEILEVDVRRGDAREDSTTYSVRVEWTNTGRLPTALRQGQLVKIVREDEVELEFDSTLTRGDAPAVTIVTPSTRDKTIRAGWTEPGERKSATFEVRVVGVPGVEGTLRLLSTRGGKQEVPLVLGRPVEN
jgi:hypothetical protein